MCVCISAYRKHDNDLISQVSPDQQTALPTSQKIMIWLISRREVSLNHNYWAGIALLKPPLGAPRGPAPPPPPLGNPPRMPAEKATQKSGSKQGKFLSFDNCII